MWCGDGGEADFSSSLPSSLKSLPAAVSSSESNEGRCAPSMMEEARDRIMISTLHAEFDYAVKHSKPPKQE